MELRAAGGDGRAEQLTVPLLLTTTTMTTTKMTMELILLMSERRAFLAGPNKAIFR
jgi:hypothetical protein